MYVVLAVLLYLSYSCFTGIKLVLVRVGNRGKDGEGIDWLDLWSHKLS